MKKLFSLFIVACLLSTMTATADIYHDGLRKMMDSGMNEQFSRQSLQELLEKEGKTEADLDKIVDKTVELIAPYYRKNFTEESFKQYLQFYTRPEMIEFQKKITMVNAITKNASKSNLVKVMMQVQDGKSPTDVFALPCSAEYEQAFNRYCQMNNMDETVEYMTAILKLSFALQSDNDPIKKNELQNILNVLLDHVKTNYRTLVRNSMLDIISIEELQSYTSAMDQPFYPSQVKAQKSMLEDIPNLLTNVVQMMEEEGAQHTPTSKYNTEDRKNLRWLSPNELITFSDIPEDGQKFYASKVTTSITENNVLCLAKTDTMVYFWDATIAKVPSGVNADNIAMVKRSGDFLTLSWTNQDRLFKKETFRILNQNSAVKEYEVYYEKDNTTRYNYFDHGMLVKTFRLNADADTIAVWKRGRDNQYIYTYNIDKYIQSVSKPDEDGKQAWTIVYRESASNQVSPPQLVNEYDLPTKLPGRLKSFQGTISGTYITMLFSESTICVYAMIDKDGKLEGDYEMTIIDTKSSISSPSSFSDAHQNEIAYIKQQHGELLLSSIRDYLKTTPLYFVPGTVNKECTQMPCVFIITLGDGTKPAKNRDSQSTTKQYSGPIYNLDTLQEKPDFPGGLQVLYKYLETNVKIRYPKSCLESKTTGRAKCQFVVEPDGSLTAVEIVNSSGNKDLDELAISLIHDMPRWSPGILNGEPVRTTYSIPIRFVLP